MKKLYFLLEVFQRGEKLADRSGFPVLFGLRFASRIGLNPEESGHVQLLDEARVDGMIILDSTLDDATVEKLMSSTKPIVMIQKMLDGDRISTISADNKGGAYTAMKHLLDLGYRDLMIVEGPAIAEDSRLRMEGCKKALREHDVAVESVAVIFSG